MRHDTVGLIGIGLVGLSVAEHLLHAGYHVVGCDIDAEACRRFEAIGGAVAAHPADVADRARRVVLSLMTSVVVRDVIEGDSGLLRADGFPEFIIDTSTGTPAEAEDLAQSLAARGITYLDATINGSSSQIRAREGVFMVGGDPDGFEACRDLFDHIGKAAVHVGPSGAGSKAKLATNLVLGLNRLAFAEGLVFAERLGLDLAAVLDLLKMTSAYSRAMDVKGEKMLKGDFSPDAYAAQHLKDLTIILSEADQTGQELPLAQVHHAILSAVVEAGGGQLDNSAVIDEIRRRRKAQP